MNLKRFFSLFLAVLMMVACLSACQGAGTSSNVTSANVSNVSSNLNSTDSTSSLPIGSEADITDDEFNNAGENDSTPTPGDSMTDEEKEASGLYDKVWVPDVEGEVEEDSPYVSEDYNYADSLLNEKDTFQYLFENDWYAYGITATGSEIIAYKDAEGKYMDILTGGGTYMIRSTSGHNLAIAGTVKSFQRLTLKNYDALIVRYNANGTEAGEAILETTYTFYEKSINVAARGAHSSSNVISNSNTNLIRNFKSGYEECIKNINYDWYYPEDGDFPIKEVDSWVTKNIIDDLHTVYTFRSGSSYHDVIAIKRI